jgi:hypothetical protein
MIGQSFLSDVSPIYPGFGMIARHVTHAHRKCFAIEHECAQLGGRKDLMQIRREEAHSPRFSNEHR